MDATAAIVAFALFVGVMYLVARPFLAPEEEAIEDLGVNPELESQKNRIIDAIREIDMDYQTGKLSDEDYQLLRSRYTAAAAEILKRIDAADAEATAREEAEASSVEPKSAGASSVGPNGLLAPTPEAPASGDVASGTAAEEAATFGAEAKRPLGSAQEVAADPAQGVTADDYDDELEIEIARRKAAMGGNRDA